MVTVRTDRLGKEFYFEYYQNGRLWRDKVVMLVLKPESYVQSEPARVNVVQTKGGFFVDHFGEGIKEINVSGTFGFRPPKIRMSQQMSGHELFLEFRDMYREWLWNVKNDPENHVLNFHNIADDEHYEIVITNFSLQRTVGRPLLYQYSLRIVCLRELGVSVTGRVMDDVSAGLMFEPKKKVEMALRSIQQEKSFLDKVLAGTIEVRRSVREWAEEVAKGLEVFDTTKGEWRKVSDIFSELSGVINDVTGYVEGSFAYIMRPFGLVLGTSGSLREVIRSLEALSDVPHEVVRALRNIVCALILLPRSAFDSYRNPGTFEGVSNCGSSLGFSPALVAEYPNSFSATAQSEITCKQMFLVPRRELFLEKEPLRVEGVWLASDVERKGDNYLDYVTGRKVVLSMVPSSPVVVQYTTKTDVVESSMKLKSAVGYIVKDGDTLARIAAKMYGDASKWKLIAVFNGLEYPYIVGLDFEKEVRAVGKVKVVKESTGTSVTIPKGWKVFVPEYMGTDKIEFVTTERVVIGYGKSEGEVGIEAVMAGTIGNVRAGLITGFEPLSGVSRVYNSQPTTGGKIWNVVKIGDVLMIPQTEGELPIAVMSSEETSYEQLFGADIKVLPNGELDYVERGGLKDLAVVSGVKNLVQALGIRINTDKGFYPYHRLYGTNLPYYIGRKGEAYYELIKVDLKDNVLMDLRVDRILSFKMDVKGDIVRLEMNVIPKNEKAPLSVNLVI